MTVVQQAARTLPEWVDYTEAMHPKEIALGLDRIGTVKERLAIAFDCPVVIVGGTNGIVV